MKKKIIIFLFSILILTLLFSDFSSQFVRANGEAIVQEQIEYEALYYQMLARVKAAPYGDPILDCFGTFTLQVEAVTPAYEAKMATKEARVNACTDAYIAADPTCVDDTGGCWVKYYDQCYIELNAADSSWYYGKILPYAQACQVCMGQEDITISISASVAELLAEGMSKSEIKVTAYKGSTPASGEAISFSIINPDNKLEDDGTLSETSIATNTAGQAVTEYTSPPIGDPEFKGATVSIQAEHAGKTFEVDIEIKPAPFITGRVVDIKGSPRSDIPLKYRFGKFRRKISTDKNGEFFIPGKKDEPCVIIIPYEYESEEQYITMQVGGRIPVKPPANLGDIILATRLQFEERSADEVLKLLIKSGMTEEDAERMRKILKDRLQYKYSVDATIGGKLVDVPTFYLSRARGPKRLFLEDTISLLIPLDNMWAGGNEAMFTFFHEYGHAVIYGLADDEGGETGKDHDIWQKTHPDTAFDEARAHFFSLLMLSMTDRPCQTAEEFTKQNSDAALKNEKVEGNKIEGVITTFWKKVYGKQMSICPSCVLRHFLDVQDRYKEKYGRPPRTIEEWQEAHGSGRISGHNAKIADEFQIKSMPIEQQIGDNKIIKGSLFITPEDRKRWEEWQKMIEEWKEKHPGMPVPVPAEEKDDIEKPVEKKKGFLTKIFGTIINFFQGIFSPGDEPPVEPEQKIPEEPIPPEEPIIEPKKQECDECVSETCIGKEYYDCVLEDDGCKHKVEKGVVKGKCGVECFFNFDCDDEQECISNKCGTETGLDLEKFPKPFLKNTMIVVGADASSVDVLACVEIATMLQNKIGKEVPKKLDDEISGQETKYNLILIGTPCENKAVETVFDIPCEGFDLGDNKAIIKLAKNGGNTAMLVAGVTPSDTLAAAKQVANYGSYDLEGSEVLI